MKRFAILIAVLAALSTACGWPARAAQSIDVVTYYDSPNADYMDLRVTGAVTAGIDDADMGPLEIDGGNYTAAFFGELDVKSNGIYSRWATSRGGWLTVAGNLNVVDETNTSLFYIDATTRRVGIGTTAPLRQLDVRGAMKARSAFAYMDTFDRNQPYAELWAEINADARFSAAYFDPIGPPPRVRFCTLHIDGDPLGMQTFVKGSAPDFEGLGRGLVVIKGETRRDWKYNSPDDKVILVVGEPFLSTCSPTPCGFYPDTPTPPESYAHEWFQFSSRAYKKDIAPLAPAEYADALGQLARTPIVRYRYKQEPPTARPRLGFVSEDAPEDMRDSSGKAIGLGEEAAFLMAAAKAIKADNASLKARLEKLRET